MSRELSIDGSVVVFACPGISSIGGSGLYSTVNFDSFAFRSYRETIVGPPSVNGDEFLLVARLIACGTLNCTGCVEPRGEFCRFELVPFDDYFGCCFCLCRCDRGLFDAFVFLVDDACSFITFIFFSSCSRRNTPFLLDGALYMIGFREMNYFS